MKFSKHLLHALPLLVALALPVCAQTATDVIYTDKAGRVLTRGDVKDGYGRISARVIYPGNYSDKAARLHARGESASMEKDFKSALRDFEAAIEDSPKWATPAYDAARIHLKQGNYTKAYALLRRVDSLSPRGYFRTRTALYTLELEQRGKLAPGTYQRLSDLEFGSILEKKETMRAALDMTARYPDFAPGWQELARMEDDPTKRLVLIEKGLSKTPDIETKGWFLVAKARALAERGNKTLALQMLGDLALDPASTAETEALAKQAIEEAIWPK